MIFKNTPSKVGLIAIAVLASPLAMADGGPWYVGASAGSSSATIDDARINRQLLGSGFSSSTIVDDDRSTGYKLLGGYHFNENIAVEGGYFDLGKFGYTATTQPAGTLVGTIKLRGFNLDLVGTMPITERFSVFGRVGATYSEARDTFVGTGAVRVNNPYPSKQDTNYKYGLGLQYALTKSLVLRTELERYRVDDAVDNKGTVDLVSVGLVYRFGGKDTYRAPVAAAPAAMPVREFAVVAPPPSPAPVPVAPPPPPARFEKYTLSATELFAFDSAALRLPQPKLDEIAKVLQSNRGVNDVVLTGYTDRLGSDKYNQKLSESRASSVKDYLVSRGVESNRMKAQGRGEANPVVVCTEKKLPALIECLEPNRRVEVENLVIERRVQ